MHPGVAAGIAGAAFWCLHHITVNVLDWAELNSNVHWVYLPSGVRLAATLLLGWPACLGITLATLFTSWASVPTPPWSYLLGTSLVSGFSPLLAHYWGTRWLDIPHDLSGLSSRTLILMAALFALISATLHQAWFWAIGWGDHSVTVWAVMTLGDFAGALVVLLVVGWLLVWWEKMR